MYILKNDLTVAAKKNLIRIYPNYTIIYKANKAGGYSKTCMPQLSLKIHICN